MADSCVPAVPCDPCHGVHGTGSWFRGIDGTALHVMVLSAAERRARRLLQRPTEAEVKIPRTCATSAEIVRLLNDHIRVFEALWIDSALITDDLLRGWLWRHDPSRIKVLRLTPPFGFTPDVLCELVASLTNLERLHVTVTFVPLTANDSACVAAVASHITDLQLDTERATWISWLRSATKLQCLYLYGSIVSSASLDAVPEGACLSYLSLDGYVWSAGADAALCRLLRRVGRIDEICHMFHYGFPLPGDDQNLSAEAIQLMLQRCRTLRLYSTYSNRVVDALRDLLRRAPTTDVDVDVTARGERGGVATVDEINEVYDRAATIVNAVSEGALPVPYLPEMVMTFML